MKIAMVSKNERAGADIVRLLRTRAPSYEVAVSDDIPDLLNAGLDPVAPDVLLVDEPSVEDGDLERLERLSHLYPRLAFIVTTPSSTPEFLLQAMRAGVREVLPTSASADLLLPAIQRIEAKRGGLIQSDGKLLAFVSCKGGSGATFLAANLGYALSTLGKRVALIDLNMSFGNASLFVSEHKPQASIADVSQQIKRLDASLLAASMIEIAPGYRMLAAPDDPAQANDIKAEHVDKIIRLLRREYDFVIADIGRSLDTISVHTLDHADLVLPVLQTTLPYIRDGKRLLEIFRSLDYGEEKIKFIVNRYEKRGEIRLNDVAAALGTKELRTIPNHYDAAAASINQGVPILKLSKNSPVSKALRELAENLLGEQSQVASNWLKRALHKS